MIMPLYSWGNWSKETQVLTAIKSKARIWIYKIWLLSIPSIVIIMLPDFSKKNNEWLYLLGKSNEWPKWISLSPITLKCKITFSMFPLAPGFTDLFLLHLATMIYPWLCWWERPAETAASLDSKEPQWVPQSLSQAPLKRVAPLRFSNLFLSITGLVKGEGRMTRSLKKKHFNCSELLTHPTTWVWDSSVYCRKRFDLGLSSTFWT